MKCKNCGSQDFEKVKESDAVALYVNIDEFYQCQDCGDMRVYGVAENPSEGFAFYLPERRLGVKPPRCPDHGDTMIPTKAWVDQEAGERIQFKCIQHGPERPCQYVETKELVDASDL